MMSTLYPWQKECLDIWAKNEYRGIVNAITGAGKTRMALAGILRLKNIAGSKLRVKIVVPGKPLLLQWKQALESIVFQDPDFCIGICGSGYPILAEKPCMIYVINSARYRLARQILCELKAGNTVLLIADECHNYTSSENQKIFEFLPYLSKLPGTYCSLGLSATFSSKDAKSVLVPALGKEIYHYSLSDALKKGTICDFAIWQIAISFQPDEQQTYQELSDAMRHTRLELLSLFPELKFCDSASFFSNIREISGKGNGKGSRLARTFLQLSYKRKRVIHMAKARISCVCRLLGELGLNKQTIIFGESIPQIEQLYDKLNHTYPGRIGRYHSKLGALANRNTLERFRTGELRILLTCRALDEGIDIPEAAVGIILSGTSMERQRLQRLGRILRNQKTKRMACLYYLFIADSFEEHAYFPRKTERFRVQNLSYDDTCRTFYFPAYEETANAVLAELSARAPANSIYAEIYTCLRRGYLREDWMLPSEECRKNAFLSPTVREQNYWFCMEQMAKFS